LQFGFDHIVGGTKGNNVKDTTVLQEHIKTLRQLISAANGLNNARIANSEMIPRKGIRGGRNTTLNARHDIAAEYYHKTEDKAEAQATEIWWPRAAEYAEQNQTDKQHTQPKINRDIIVAACINTECGWFGLSNECSTQKHDVKLLCPDCHEIVETRLTIGRA
jgi:hypothetical protein